MSAPAGAGDATGEAAGQYDREYYQGAYGEGRLRRFDSHWWSARMYAGIARWCLERGGGRRVLEIGCGHGFVLSFLERRYETFGVDLSEYAVEQCARVAPRSICSVGDIEQGLPGHLERGTFDLVLARYVLEHLKDPRAALEHIAELLRPGGALFFAVPNTESLGARWKGSEWYAALDPTHCSMLAPERWLEVTRAAGFEVERETADGHWDVPYVRWLPTWAQLPIFAGPTMLACLAARPLLPARFGENLLVVARREPGGVEAAP